MSVHKLQPEHQRETIATLEELLRLAKAKQLSGILVSCWYEKPDPTWWMTGPFLVQPNQTLASSARLTRCAVELINAKDNAVLYVHSG